MAKVLNDTTFYSMVSQNLGLVSVQMRHYDKAIEYFHIALEDAVVEEKIKIQIS